VHDRRIDGELEIFGNAGTLFMNAMTWYDHSTTSIWSQPWGRAIEGDRKGIELFLLPSQITTWENWLTEHPETLVMINDADRFSVFRQRFDPDFVIGLFLGDAAKAFHYEDVVTDIVVNDFVGDFPVLVWGADQNFHAYVRQVGDQVLTFRQDESSLTDVETGSFWDISRGLAVGGPLQGESLQPVPGMTSFDWVWLDFYPDSDFYNR
jgi:hypothetical protein